MGGICGILDMYGYSWPRCEFVAINRTSWETVLIDMYYTDGEIYLCVTQSM